jgi:hypothetical protein
LIFFQETPGGLFKLVDDGSVMDIDDQSNLDVDEPQSNNLNYDSVNMNSSFSNRYNNNRVKSNRRGSTTPSRPPCGYLVFASDSRKRLVRDNPGIPFGEMSRIIGDQVKTNSYD